MAVTVALIAVLLAIAGWWLSRQRLMAKPWLEVGIIGETDGTGPLRLPAAKLGLGVFLAVVGSLFALLVSALTMHRAHGMAGHALHLPAILWLNTALLVLSSLALHRAQVAARADELPALRRNLYASGATALCFVLGQLLAWHQLAARGHPLTQSAAADFFYLLTAIHGLHILGGLVALGRAVLRMERGAGPRRLQASVELCATYWHFLLLVWLVLFAILLFT